MKEDPLDLNIKKWKVKKIEEKARNYPQNLSYPDKFQYARVLACKDPESGIQYLKELLEQKDYPNVVGCLYYLSVAYANNDDIDQALKFCNQAFKIATKTEDINGNIILMKRLLELDRDAKIINPIRNQNRMQGLTEAVDNRLDYMIYVAIGVVISIFLSIFYFLKK